MRSSRSMFLSLGDAVASAPLQRPRSVVNWRHGSPFRPSAADGDPARVRLRPLLVGCLVDALLELRVAGAVGTVRAQDRRGPRELAAVVGHSERLQADGDAD